MTPTPLPASDPETFLPINTWVKKRGNEDVYYCDVYSCYSNWDNWGRWVALAVIVVCILILTFLLSCLNTRRRRRRGMAPMYGTGWMPTQAPWEGRHYQQNQNSQGYYTNDPYNQGAIPPPYVQGGYKGVGGGAVGTQQTGNTFNSNEGYYGHHGNGGQDGIELQQPSSSYQPQRGGDPVYDAPAGPPPNKGDGVIR